MNMQPANRASRPFKLPLLQNFKPPAETAVPQAPAAQVCEAPASSQPRLASRPFRLPLLSKPASTVQSPATANSTIPQLAPAPSLSNRSTSILQQPHAATAAAGKSRSFLAPVKASTAVTSSSTGHGSNSSSKPPGQRPHQVSTAHGQPGSCPAASVRTHTNTSTPAAGSAAKRPAGSTTVLASKRRKVQAPATAAVAAANLAEPSVTCSSTNKNSSTSAAQQQQAPVQDTAQPQAPSLRRHSNSRRRSINTQHTKQPEPKQHQPAATPTAVAAHVAAAPPAAAAVQANSAAVVTETGGTAQEDEQMQQDLTDTPVSAAAEAAAAGAVQVPHMSSQQHLAASNTVAAAAGVNGGGISSAHCGAAASKPAEQRDSMCLQATCLPAVAAAPAAATVPAPAAAEAAAVMTPGKDRVDSPAAAAGVVPDAPELKQGAASAAAPHDPGDTPGQDETARTTAAATAVNLQPPAQVPAKAALPARVSTAAALAAPPNLDRAVVPPEQIIGCNSSQPSAGTGPLTAAAAEDGPGTGDMPAGREAPAATAAAAAGAGQIPAKQVVMERLPVPKVCQSGSAWGPTDQQGLPGLLDLTAKMPRLKPSAGGAIDVPQIQQQLQQSSRGLTQVLIRQMVPKRIHMSTTAAAAAAAGGGAQCGKAGRVTAEGAAGAAGCSSGMYSVSLQGVLRSALLQDHVQSGGLNNRSAAGSYFSTDTLLGIEHGRLLEPRVDSRAVVGQGSTDAGAALLQQQQQCDNREVCPAGLEGCSDTAAAAGSDITAAAGKLNMVRQSEAAAAAAAAAEGVGGVAGFGPGVGQPFAVAADFSDCQELLAVMAAVLE